MLLRCLSLRDRPHLPIIRASVKAVFLTSPIALKPLRPRQLAQVHLLLESHFPLAAHPPKQKQWSPFSALSTFPPFRFQGKASKQVHGKGQSTNLLTSRHSVGRSLEVLLVTKFQNLAVIALKSASFALKIGALKLRSCYFEPRVLRSRVIPSFHTNADDAAVHRATSDAVIIGGAEALPILCLSDFCER